MPSWEHTARTKAAASNNAQEAAEVCTRSELLDDMQADPFVSAILDAALDSESQTVEQVNDRPPTKQTGEPTWIHTRKSADRPSRQADWVREFINLEAHSDKLRQRLKDLLSELQPTFRLEDTSRCKTKKNVKTKAGAVGHWDGRKLVDTAMKDPWAVWGDASVTSAKEEEVVDGPLGSLSLATRIQATSHLTASRPKRLTAVFQSSLTAPTPFWILREQSLFPPLLSD